MENPPFEHVFPIGKGEFPLLCLFTGGYYMWKYGKKEPSSGTENQIQNSRKPCMVRRIVKNRGKQEVIYISQWPQELLAHSLVATPLNLLKHQNCHPEFLSIMTQSWMILVHRCIFRTSLPKNSYMFTCDVQHKKKSQANEHSFHQSSLLIQIRT